MSANLILGATTLINATSQIVASQQQKQNELYNARIAEAEAQALRTSSAFQSETLKKQGAVERAQIEREKRKTLSAQRAAYTASGVRIDTGTPLDVMADTAAQFEIDLATSRYNTEVGLESLRYDTEVGVARAESDAEYRRRLARQSGTAGYLKAGTTLLTGYGVYKKNNPTIPET